MRLSVARALVIVLVLMVDAASVFAQVPEDDEPVRRWQFGVGATLAMPVGDFSKHVDASPGFYLQLDRRVAKSPVSLGGDFAYIQYAPSAWTNWSRKSPALS